MATYVAETCWRILCNKITSKYYCAFVGINIVFIWLIRRIMNHTKQIKSFLYKMVLRQVTPSGVPDNVGPTTVQHFPVKLLLQYICVIIIISSSIIIIMSSSSFAVRYRTFVLRSFTLMFTDHSGPSATPRNFLSAVRIAGYSGSHIPKQSGWPKNYYIIPFVLPREINTSGTWNLERK